MKKIIACLFFFSTFMLLWGQPKQATKALLKVTTYDRQGAMLQQGTAFFITEEGTAIANYGLFVGAAHAEVADVKGKVYPVTKILGGSSMVDMVKFRADVPKKVPFLLIATTPAKVASKAYLLSFQKEKAQLEATTVRQSTPYQNLQYYDLALANVAEHAGCPLLTEEGTVFGVYQKNVSKEAQTACAMDVRFADSLKISSTSSFNNDLQKIFIAKALPTDPAQARAYVYLQSNMDSVAYGVLLDEYIATFPDLPEGWVDRANFWVKYRNYDLAETDFTKALSIATRTKSAYGADEVHYAWSKAIYEKELLATGAAPTHWNLDKALEQVRHAYTIKALPFYKKQEGVYLFAKKEYAAAYTAFAAVNRTDFASPETYFNAAQALERLGTDTALLVATLDTMMLRCAHPYTQEAAPYLLARAGFYNRMARYKAALADLNTYELLIGKERLGAQFYYTREQVALSARLYQLAINNIQEAIRLAPENTFFLIEEALIYLRAGEFQTALQKATKTLEKIPENPDCYKITGIAHGELGQKEKALQMLEKAKALGDESVQTFIERYRQ